jgi:uncharacterized protein YuzE
MSFHYCYSQFNCGPTPTIGWDSLKTLIKYPPLAQRAGLDGNIIITVDIDSTGKVMNKSIKSDAEIFTIEIDSIFKQIKWKPAVENGKHKRSMLRLPMYFFLNKVIEGQYKYLLYDGPCILIDSTAQGRTHINY